ncbi:MAG: MBL fold metallo-hydrolase [Glaciecola sp.]
MNIHLIQGYIQNTFLVEYEHGCLLLDGASRQDYHLIKQFFAETLRRPFTDLKVVIVTHMHPDHAGCAHKLRQATGCKIVSGQFERQWYAGFGGRLQHIIDLSLGYWVAGRLGRGRQFIYYPPHVYPDIKLADGEPIPGFEDWKVLYTPGHTTLDISVVNETERVLYAADLIVWVRKAPAPPYPVHLPQAYKDSLERIKAYVGFDILLAHVKRQPLTASMLEAVLAKAPDLPKTTWETVKSKARVWR